MTVTVRCPKGHVTLADVSVGTAYGHVPGHQYHDVDVMISRKGDRYRCQIVETWGSAQGYDEEHGRKEAIGRGGSTTEASDQARATAQEADIHRSFLARALSQAIDQAEEADD